MKTPGGQLTWLTLGPTSEFFLSNQGHFADWPIGASLIPWDRFESDIKSLVALKKFSTNGQV